MDVRCEKCSTEYEFDENRIGANGVTVKCTACGFVFKVRRPKKAPAPRATTTLGKGPQGREWLVRKPDGQMIAFRELTTLQKWIVEGRINRDDEISKNGETWKRLGNILELEPFFSVYEKARALNDLMENRGDPRVEIRGSEVLATMDPLSQIPSLGQGLATPVPRRDTDPPPRIVSGPTTNPDYSQSPSFANTQRVSPPPYPVVQGSPAMPPPLADHILTVPPPIPSRHTPINTPRNGFGANGTGSMPRRPSASNADTSPPMSLSGGAQLDHRVPSMLPIGGPILDGPPPVERATTRPPPGWGGSSLSISLEDTGGTPRPDVVDKFERGQKRRRAYLWVALIVVLGLGGGVALAKFGPAGNQLQVIAERYGLLSPKAHSDGATPHIEDAFREFDLDTLSSLASAEKKLEQAQAIRTDDPKIKADRALVMMTRVESLRRQRSIEDEEASTLAKKSFELAKSAYASAPRTYEPARALAEYYRVQQDYKNFAEYLTIAKAATAESGATDGALMYIEAASMAMGSSEAEIDRGIALAERSLTARPSMNRARVLLARVLIKKNAPGAKAQLDKVLAVAPDHEEALKLKALLEAPPPVGDKPAETAVVSDKQPSQPETAPADKAAADKLAAEKAASDKLAADKAAADKTAAEKAATPEKPAEQGYDALMLEADRFRERDKPKKALASYEKAADLKPRSAEPLTGMGWSYIDLEKPQAALNSFKKAIRVNDRFVEAYFGQAEAHRMLGETEKAIELYEMYLDKAPNGADRKAAERALAQLKK